MGENDSIKFILQLAQCFVSIGAGMKQKTAGFLLPYLAAGFGIFVFHNAWLAILSYHIGILTIVLLSKNRPPVESLFKSRNRKIPVVTALIGAGGGILLYILWPYMDGSGQIKGYMQSIGLIGKAWPLFIVYFILVNALLEEYFWRGLLAGRSRGVTLNDVFVSGYHPVVLLGGIGALWLVAIFLILVPAGWVWRQVNRTNDGLLPSVACHIAADISVILTAYLMTR